MTPQKLFFGMQLSLTKRNNEKICHIFLGLLPNPNFKVFFIINQARRLIFGMYLVFNIIREILSKKLEIYYNLHLDYKNKIMFIIIR